MTGDYTVLTNLYEVYLEDSYVLAITREPDSLIFELDAALTTESPMYHERLPGEQYCYARGALRFDNIRRVDWLTETDGRAVDATGEKDLGNIDTLVQEDAGYRVEGDWGGVRIITDAPPRFAYSS